MSLIYLSCAWLAGIVAGSEFDLPLALAFTGLLPLALLFYFRERKKLLLLTCLCLVAFFGGAACFQSSLPANNADNLQFYNDRGIVEIRGLVNEDPESGDKTVKLRLSAREMKLGGEWQKVTGTALLYVPGYPAYSYGDLLLVTGEPETPPRLDGFDYQAYLAHQEIFSVMSYPEIEIIESGKGLKPLEWLYSFRNRLSQTFTEILPEPQASLAQGIILGIRSGIPESVKTDFVHTGTAHLLAISGLHLSVITGMLLNFGIRLFGRKRYLYVWLALGGVWIYALLTGMNPPVLRAAIMATLFLAAELLGRQRNAATALAFAAAVMAGFSPQILWQASFQMSFAAMAGLVLIFPLIQSFLKKLIAALPVGDGIIASAAFYIADSLGVGIAALAAIWPLVAYHFGIISPAAPLATLFALPALPGIIFIGASAGILGMIFLPSGQVIAWIAWLFISYTLLVVRIFAAVPFLEGSYLDIRLVWLYYPALAFIIRLINARSKTVSSEQTVTTSFFGTYQKWLVLPLLAIAILVLVTAATMPDDNLHVSFLDVGQGDAILIQKGSRQILIDGGPDPQAVIRALGEKMPFWDRTLDLAVLTHSSADHVTGLVEVLKRYRVKQALYPKADFSSSIYNEWLRLLEEKNIPVTLAESDQCINLDGTIIEVLNPRPATLTGTQSDIDNNAIVLRVKTGEVSFLLTADIMQEAEFELIYSRAELESTVLKVAHHGSATSTSEEFLSVANPMIAVISVGENNTFGHPRNEVLARLEAIVGKDNIYRTDENGTVEFITDGSRLWVEVLTQR